MSPFSSYFDHVSVINLPSRPDRLSSIRHELSLLGFSSDRISVPEAPIPQSSNGFPSKGVYGNYLSHLGILKNANNRNASRALVLEDDAIFSMSARSHIAQQSFIDQAEKFDWEMWFLGHRLRKEIKNEMTGVIPNAMAFTWAHAYAVRGEVLSDLIMFLEDLMSRPEGHECGKMYIDGAFSHFRMRGSSRPCLISNPALSIQKGSDSNLAGPNSPGRIRVIDYPKVIARNLRDNIWRLTGHDFR